MATGAPVWTETPDDPGAAAIAPTNSVFADPDIPGADGHGVAVAFSGRSGTNKHLVQILDTRTGAVLTTHETSRLLLLPGLHRLEAGRAWSS